MDAPIIRKKDDEYAEIFSEKLKQDFKKFILEKK